MVDCYTNKFVALIVGPWIKHTVLVHYVLLWFGNIRLTHIFFMSDTSFTGTGIKCTIGPSATALKNMSIPVAQTHSAPVSYPTMHHFVTEMCTCISITKWFIVGHLSDALWNFLDGSIADNQNTTRQSTALSCTYFMGYTERCTTHTNTMTLSWHEKAFRITDPARVSNAESVSMSWPHIMSRI